MPNYLMAISITIEPFKNVTTIQKVRLFSPYLNF